MNKGKLKFLVDVLLFIDICAISTIGLLMAFVIPRGEHRRSIEKSFMGLHRHGWGDVHLYLSLFLLLLLILHIYLNWKWVVGCAKQYFGAKWKVVLCLLPLGGFLLLLVCRILVTI